MHTTTSRALRWSIWALVALLIGSATVGGVMLSLGRDAETTTDNSGCADAVPADAVVDIVDDIGVLDDAMRDCQSLAEFDSETSSAINDSFYDARVWATNRCTVEPSLRTTAVCADAG